MARDIQRRGEFGGFLDLRHEIDRLFENFFELGGGAGSLARRGDFVPRIELQEVDQGFVIRAELPGLKPEEVSIEVDGNVLTLRGERKRETQKSRGGFEYSEANYGSFVRSVELPGGIIDASKVEARMEQGILEVTVPKSETARPRKIPVRAAGEQLTPGGQQPPSQSTEAGPSAKGESSQSQRSAPKS